MVGRRHGLIPHGLWLGIVTAVVVLLQTAVFPSLRFFNATPDVVLLFAVLLGFLAGPRSGLAGAVAAGLLVDIWTGRLIGAHTLISAAAALAAAFVGRNVYRENTVAAFLLVSGATIAHDAVTFLLIRLLGIPFPMYRAVYAVLIPGLLYNLLLTPPLYLALYLITEREPAAGERSPVSGRSV